MTLAPSKRDAQRVCSASVTDAPPAPAQIASILATSPGELMDGGEIVILCLKPSMWRPVFDSKFWLLGSVLVAALMFWTQVSLPGLSLATSAQCVLMLGLTRLAFAVAHWVPRWHMLTNHRVIDVSGVRSVCCDSQRLIDIRTTYLHRSPGECVVGVGSITMASTNPNADPLIWRHIPQPDKVHAAIRRAIQNVIDYGGY